VNQGRSATPSGLRSTAPIRSRGDEVATLDSFSDLAREKASFDRAKVTGEGLPLFNRGNAMLGKSLYQINEANRGRTNALERAISRGGDLITVTPVTAPSAPAGEMPVDAAQGNGRRGNDAGGIQAAHWKFAEHVAGIFGKQVIPVVADGDFHIGFSLA